MRQVLLRQTGGIIPTGGSLVAPIVPNHNNTIPTGGVTSKISAAAPEAAKAASFAERYVTGRVKAHGGGLEGMRGAASKTWGQVKDIVSKDATMGERGMGAVRGGSVVLGSVIALSSLKAKDAQGNDRGIVNRGSRLLLGTGMVAAGVLAGGR